MEYKNVVMGSMHNDILSVFVSYCLIQISENAISDKEKRRHTIHRYTAAADHPLQVDVRFCLSLFKYKHHKQALQSLSHSKIEFTGGPIVCVCLYMCMGLYNSLFFIWHLNAKGAGRTRVCESEDDGKRHEKYDVHLKTHPLSIQFYE